MGKDDQYDRLSVGKIMGSSRDIGLIHTYAVFHHTFNSHLGYVEPSVEIGLTEVELEKYLVAATFGKRSTNDIALYNGIFEDISKGEYSDMEIEPLDEGELEKILSNSFHLQRLKGEFQLF